MFIVWIIITAMGFVLPVLIRLVLWVPQTAWPAEYEKAKRAWPVRQPESTYGSTATAYGRSFKCNIEVCVQLRPSRGG
jgi:hypothetical protein